jgi:diguanylate cyclase (GGDEF)-like protein/PAS domain S-box-containing protein
VERNYWITIIAGLPQILSLIVLLFMAIFTWQKRSNIKWANYFFLTLFSLAVWDIGDILELFSRSQDMYSLTLKITYLGIATLPLFWFLFIIGYIGKDPWYSPGKIAISAVIPLLTILFTITNESHHLMRTIISYDPTGQFSIVISKYGPWFWVHSANSYIFLLLGTILLIRSAFTNSGFYLSQKIILIFTCVIPWVSNILYLTKVTSADYTSSAFTLLSLGLVFSVFRFQLLDLIPIARDIVVENMRDAVIVLDQGNRIIDVNPAVSQAFDRNAKTLVGKTVKEVFPEYADFIENQNENNLTLKEVGFPSDNPRQYFTVQITQMRANKAKTLGKVVVLRDSTEQIAARESLQKNNLELETRVEERTAELVQELEIRKQIESALRESEERYSLAIQGANDGLWDWNLRTNQVFYSPHWKSMVGYCENEIEPTIEAWFQLVLPEDIDLLQMEISRHLENLTPLFQFTHRLIRKDGNILWVLCRGLAKRGEDGVAYRMSGSLTDITQQKKDEEQILHDAFHDGLTGLPNRAFFLERVSHSIQRAKRAENEQYAVLFLDLDRFKNINDSLGHSYGDQLLQVCADRLQCCIRKIDTVARLGGDEFVVLIDSISGIQELNIVVERIIASITQPIILDSHELSITSSIGIVLFSNQYETAEEILRDADIAMYQAKRNKVIRYEFFNPEMREIANKRLELEIELRRALEFGEFELYYQPIMKVQNNQMVSFEALIRWNQPSRGFVLPMDFIPIAEETGFIIPIGQWVISEVCHQISEWKKIVPDDYHISVNLNLSARQFSDVHLYEKIRKYIQESSIEGNNLVLEITESAIFEDRESAIQTLEKFKSLGIQVHIDDFGTGYSSLSYLHTLPFDALKIDRSFVNQISKENDVNGIEIIQTIISLGKELGKKVVAEGVETQQELDLLTKLNCGYIQGYLISRPMDRETASAFLSNEVQKITPGLNERTRTRG